MTLTAGGAPDCAPRSARWQTGELGASHRGSGFPELVRIASVPIVKVLIVGAGIGGLATALFLHEAGIECEVYERSPAIRELGVGLNALPLAVAPLAGLGLLHGIHREGAYGIDALPCHGRRRI